MTTEELQAILQDPKKLTLKEIKQVIYELKQDCFDMKLFGKKAGREIVCK